MDRPAPDTRIAELCAAVRFDGGMVAFAGHRREARTQVGGWPAPATTDPRVATLQALLYEHAYCRRQPATGAAAVASPADRTSLASHLAAANTSRERWDPGWEVIDYAQGGQTMVGRDARTRLVWPGEYLGEVGTGAAPRPGARVSLFVPRGSDALQPGFYYAFGETLGDQGDEDHLLRFYWHLNSAGAAGLTAELTGTLNRHAVPFRFKALTGAAGYPRCDAAVLYVAQRWYPIVAMLVEAVHARVAGSLGSEVPLFARELAPGLGFAEDPGGSESFGMQRCRLAAQGLVAAHDAGGESASERLAAIACEFEHAGLDLAVPHLNGGGPDRYGFPLPS